MFVLSFFVVYLRVYISIINIHILHKNGRINHAFAGTGLICSSNIDVNKMSNQNKEQFKTKSE